jgi:ribulose-5-phosphate 4-epimerase/fuculose-1-phosphate aldolase
MLVMHKSQEIEEALARAAARLTGKGVLAHGDTLSQRIPERKAFVAVRIRAGHDVPEHFEWSDLSGGPINLHHRIYLSRPDVGAIVAANLTWSSKLSRLDLSLPAVFHEQVRHLGVEVRRVAMCSSDHGPFVALSNGANAYWLDDVSLCFGTGLERLLLNIEILEECAQAYVLAAHTESARLRHVPWLFRFMANRRLIKERKEAARRHLSGLRSITKAGY